MERWARIEAWMDCYGDRIMRAVYLIVQDYHQAEEITQDVFMKAYHKLSSFRGESSDYTWLYRIALNLARNNLRRKARIRFLPLDKGELEGEDRGERLEDETCRKTVRDNIRRCIARLPLKYREVVVLHYFEDMKIADIANILGQPAGTIKSKLSRGREALEQMLREEGLDHGEE